MRFGALFDSRGLLEVILQLSAELIVSLSSKIRSPRIFELGVGSDTALVAGHDVAMRVISEIAVQPGSGKGFR